MSSASTPSCSRSCGRDEHQRAARLRDRVPRRGRALSRPAPRRAGAAAAALPARPACVRRQRVDGTGREGGRSTAPGGQRRRRAVRGREGPRDVHGRRGDPRRGRGDARLRTERRRQAGGRRRTRHDRARRRRHAR